MPVPNDPAIERGDMDNLERIDSWYALFDELCNETGYFDDAALASAYCSLTRSKGQKQFEAAMRNLNNWRSGRHVPRPANLKVLARLLNVEHDPVLEARWNDLYRQSKAGETARPGLPAVYAPLPAIEAKVVDVPSVSLIHLGRHSPPRWTSRQALAGALSMLLLGAVAGSMITASGWRPWGGPADGKPIIPFNPVVNMKLGDSRAIYAVRGDCGKLPPEWNAINLPMPRTGALSDGGLARRYSKFCEGVTPARAIVFSAKVAGVEEFEIQGDFFKMTVVD